jgi:acetaldehyde dehydrogenase (acetylating)
MELINYGGRGHSLVIHAMDNNVIMQFGLEKPVFRILVNTFGTLGATGYTTGLSPSMTLGSGGVGGAITGDNISVHHLYNIKRLAYEIQAPPPTAFAPGSTDDVAQRRAYLDGGYSMPAAMPTSESVDSQVEEIVKRVLMELKK